MYYNRFRYYDSNSGTYISQDPIRLLGGYSFYSYVHDVNSGIDIFGYKADFIVTTNGTIVPTNKDINLVSTGDDGGWFQVHFTHEHDGLSPHTHYPEVNTSTTGATSTVRRYNETTAEDLDFVDEKLRNGEMRERRGRRDRGGNHNH